MKQFSHDKVPADMFTKSRLKKMGLFPISRHSAYVTYPPNKRRYKLYKFENVRPLDNTTGYSLLVTSRNTYSKSLTPKEIFQEIRNRFKPEQ